MMRARLIASASFRWCQAHTPDRRRGAILAWLDIKRRNSAASL